MILPMPDRRLLITHRGALVAVDPEGVNRTYQIGSGSLMRLVEGKAGHFAVKHHDFTDPPVRLITAHHVDDVTTQIARIEIDESWTVTGAGDPQVWKTLPPLFTLVYPYVLRFSPERAEVMRLPGLPATADHPADPLRLVPGPDGDHAIVSQTHGGRFAVYDLESGEVVTDLTLGHGSSIFRYHPVRRELWMAIHDTIFRIDVAMWSVLGAQRIRREVRGSVISDIAFNAGGDRLAVATSERRPVPLLQPYRLAPVTGRVLVIDTDRFEVVAGLDTERWVDELTFVSDDVLALRERAGELHVAVGELEPAEDPLYPPRADGDEWA